jgi:hypothetical protein
MWQLVVKLPNEGGKVLYESEMECLVGKFISTNAFSGVFGSAASDFLRNNLAVMGKYSTFEYSPLL